MQLLTSLNILLCKVGSHKCGSEWNAFFPLIDYTQFQEIEIDGAWLHQLNKSHKSALSLGF